MGYFWSGQVGGERRGFFSLHLIQYIMIIPAHVLCAAGEWSPKHNTIMEMGPGFQFLLRGGWGGGGGGEQLWELRARLFVALYFVAHSTKMQSYAL